MAVYISFQNCLNLAGAKVISLTFLLFSQSISPEKSIIQSPVSTSKRVLVSTALGSFCLTFLNIFSVYYYENINMYIISIYNI